MIIEKSPFYKKTEIHNESLKTSEKNVDSTKNEDEFSFWSWFKGLVNPLQNLPLISGIYSSVNSENEESDRDLVQNSLGGFLYGGPFGAIAGFGTWVFNKLFDKTPTEMVLDSTGISNIWKDEKSQQIASNESQLKTEKSNNKKLYIQYSALSEKNLSYSKERTQEIIENSNSKLDKKMNLVSLKNTENLEKNTSLIPQLSLDKNKSSGPQTNSFEQKDNKHKKNSPLIPELGFDKKVFQESQKNSIKKVEIPTDKKTITEGKFREINFSYPEWKPKNVKIEDVPNPELKKKYLDLLGQHKVNKGINLNA
jgi:hypothetical protein